MRPRQFSDRQLCETAQRVFLEQGSHAPIAAVASELGVSAAALFKRVGSKDELLRRAFRCPVPTWIEDVAHGPDRDLPVPDQLRTIAARIDAFFRELIPAISVLRSSGICPGDMFAEHSVPPPVRAVRALSDWFAALHAQHRVRAENPTAIAVAFLGALQARHALRHMIGNAYPDGGPDFLDVLVQTFWSGLDPRRS